MYTLVILNYIVITCLITTCSNRRLPGPRSRQDRSGHWSQLPSGHGAASGCFDRRQKLESWVSIWGIQDPKSKWFQGIWKTLENKWWMCVWSHITRHGWFKEDVPSFGHSHNESRNGRWKLMNLIWSDFFVLMILMNLVAGQLTFPWSGQVGTPAFLPGFGSPELMGGLSLPTTGFIGSQKDQWLWPKDQVESSWSWHKYSTQNSLPADATYRTI